MMSVLSKLFLKAIFLARPALCLGLWAASNSVAFAAEQPSLNPLLESLQTALAGTDILVSENLNARDVAGARPAKPRLGGFIDLPEGRFPSTDEILEWELAFAAEEIGAMAILNCDRCAGNFDKKEFLANWLNAKPGDRVLISYHVGADDVLQNIEQAALSVGFAVLKPKTPEVIGAELFATVGRRLGLDTPGARASKSTLAELDFLGRKIRRKSESIFRKTDRRSGTAVAKNEPAKFLKESLGDEFTQSTIREVIVPGGVALGETARVKLELDTLEFDGSQLWLIDRKRKRWQLPAQDLAVTKSLFDFVQRSDQIRSDAIVDIDGEGRVRISSALRDTDVGYEIMHADTQPFEYVRNLDVTKSVIIDTYVSWQALDDDSLSFKSEYEVRFLSADNMRIAQTRAALVYAYDAANKETRYDEAWGKEARKLKENLDYDGLGSSLEKVADYSGWVALFRHILENDVEFMRGRYQFMKLDSAGKVTPARY